MRGQSKGLLALRAQIRGRLRCNPHSPGWYHQTTCRAGVQPQAHLQGAPQGRRVVVAELRRRAIDVAEKKKARENNDTLKQQGRAIAQNQNLSADQARAADLFKLKSPDEVTKAWLAVCIKKAIPLDFFDDPTVRSAMLLTARCGSRLFVGNEV